MIAGRLAALASAGAVAEHEAPAKADGAGSIVWRGGDNVEGLVHGPGAGEMIGMGFAGIDHGLKLGVGQAVAQMSAGSMGR